VLLACQQADASPIPLAREAIELARAAWEETAVGEAEGGLFSCGRVRIAGYAATLGLREGSLPAVLSALAAAEDAVAEGEEAPYASLAQVRLVAALGLLAMASLKIGIGRSIALSGSRDGFRVGMAAVMDDGLDGGRASIDG
jgi:hypothetical protein